MKRGLIPPLALLVALWTAVPAAGTVNSELRHDPEDGSVEIVFTGDTLIHVPISLRAKKGDGYDFRSMFTRVAPILRGADLAICHLEVPLSPTSSGISGYPNFTAPAEVADALAWAGYDGCSTASNHSFDRGVSGVLGTLEVLAGAGLTQAGMAASRDDGWSASVYQVGDLQISHISATYWLNGYRMPDDEQWYVQLLDVDEILAIAAREKRSGSDLVVVSAHCCVEYRNEPTDAQREMYLRLIESPDVDLVVGTHSHVIGPIEEVDGEYILYGLGNFISAQNFQPDLADGVIVNVRAANDGRRWAFVDVEVVPTWVQPGTYQIMPALGYRPDSYRRTMANVGTYGASPAYLVWMHHPGYRLPQF